MLSSDEKKYIQTIPEDKKVAIKPFSNKATQIANEIIGKVKEVDSGLEVIHMGASGLGISGQGDLDVYILVNPVRFNDYLPKLIKIFGEPKSKKFDSIAWEMKQDDYEIELYLTDPNSEPMKKQIKIFETLKNNPELLSKYEKLKEEMNGKSFRNYQEEKYKFYHKILEK